MGVITSFGFALIVIIPLWRICERAGLQPAISLLALVPVVGFVLVALILAFSAWNPSAGDFHQPDLFDRGRR
ncbi:MAG: hypothetical protein JO021_02875 [Alphaproteobacteria bacterium]|nr:hypothetical protein [Alphaproteobacteria bacterium]